MSDYLNNNDVDDIVNQAYSIATGQSEVTKLTLKDIIDAGASDGGALVGKKEQFTKALISLWAKNFYTDTAYTEEADDPYFVDSREWGAITQMISAQAPAVQESHAWRQFISGTSTVGQYTVFLPIVSTKYYGKSISWEIPITISYEQYADAFTGAEGFNSFRAYIFTVLRNAIIQHRKDMNNANRNNFIAEKWRYQETVITRGEYYVQITHVAAATDKITIMNHEIEWVSSGATGQQINLPASDTAAKEVTALVNYLNGLTTGEPSGYVWSAGTGGNTDRLYCKQKADAVHAIPLTVKLSAEATMTVGEVQTITSLKNPVGVHVFKLRSAYNREMAQSVATKEAFMKDKECLRYMARKMAEYAGYLTEQTAVFNTEQLVKFCPKSRLVVEILAYAEQAANSILQADTFHDMYTSLPQHRSISAWQGLGNGEFNYNTEINFNDVSKVFATVDDGTDGGADVELRGIVGFIADKYAILHTIRSERVGAQNFDIDAVDHYAYQFRDQYMNNLTQNAIVFMVD